jgi:hypothetical protein
MSLCENEIRLIELQPEGDPRFAEIQPGNIVVLFAGCNLPYMLLLSWTK